MSCKRPVNKGTGYMPEAGVWFQVQALEK